MTLFNPQAPERVQIVQLPENPLWLKAVSISDVYVRADERSYAAIDVWTHREWNDEVEIILNKTGGTECFKESNCDECKYYFDSKEYDSEDDNGNLIEGTLYSKCSMYRDGTVSCWPCAAGHHKPDDDSEYVKLPNMRFSQLMLGATPTFNVITALLSTCPVLAFFQGIKRDGDAFLASELTTAINGYGDGSICWGSKKPQSLLDGMIAYTQSGFNEDLQEINSIKLSIEESNDDYCDEADDIDFLWYDNGESERPSAIAYINAYISPSTFLILSASGVFGNSDIALCLDLFHFEGQAYYYSRTTPLFIFSSNGDFLGPMPDEIKEHISQSTKELPCPV